MVERRDRTLELYKTIGEEARLLKHFLTTFVVDSSKILYANDSDRLSAITHKIEKMISAMEDQMFRDYPDLGHDYINVFYGGLFGEAINSVDSEITQKISMNLLKTLVKMQEMEADPN